MAATQDYQTAALRFRYHALHPKPRNKKTDHKPAKTSTKPKNDPTKQPKSPKTPQKSTYCNPPQKEEKPPNRPTPLPIGLGTDSPLPTFCSPCAMPQLGKMVEEFPWEARSSLAAVNHWVSLKLWGLEFFHIVFFLPFLFVWSFFCPFLLVV